MTDTVRQELDALDLLMQDHRELESLFRDFEHLQRNRKDTTAVIAAACAELKMHDTLQNEVFYCAVTDADTAGATAALVNDAEDEHDIILELIEKLEHTRGDPRSFETRFAVLAERMQKHIIAEETKLFPLVRTLEKLDLLAVAAAIRNRRPQLLATMGIVPAEIAA